MKPFISLCMIVKNEEKVLERCLSSVAHLVSEVIIVDTGSTDQTKEIAGKYTSNIYNLEWTNDFSYARNFAASKAHGEWIVVLDADEYVDEENFNSFLKQLKNDDGKYNTYFAKIINFTGENGGNTIQNYHDRIYKNNQDISYYRKIHEQFYSKSDAPLSRKQSELIIFHSGYMNKVMHEKKKEVRNKQLLDRELKAGKNKGFDYFNFGNEYYSVKKYSDALSAYMKAYKLKENFQLSWVSSTMVQIISCLIQLKRYNDALLIIKDAENVYINAPEFPCLRGEIFFTRGQVEDAEKEFLHIIQKDVHYHHIILRPDLKAKIPHMRLGEIYLYQEKYQEAIYHFTSVLNIDKNNENCIRKTIYILGKFHSAQEISSFLQKSNLVDSNNITLYVKACFDIGSLELSLALLKSVHGYEHERNLLYKVALLKDKSVKGESIEGLSDILNYSIVKELTQLNLINVVDLFLLGKQADRNPHIKELMEHIKNEELLKKLTFLMNGQEIKEPINGELFVFSLRIFANYQAIHFCEALLKNVQQLNEKYFVNVAALLFEKGFKAEALQLYDEANWAHLEAQDFLNIINSLLKVNNIEEAVKVCSSALVKFKEDFRFYQLILANTNDRYLYNKTLKQVKKRFGESIYLNNATCGNRKDTLQGRK